MAHAALSAGARITRPLRPGNREECGWIASRHPRSTESHDSDTCLEHFRCFVIRKCSASLRFVAFSNRRTRTSSRWLSLVQTQSGCDLVALWCPRPGEPERDRVPFPENALGRLACAAIACASSDGPPGIAAGPARGGREMAHRMSQVRDEVEQAAGRAPAIRGPRRAVTDLQRPKLPSL